MTAVAQPAIGGCDATAVVACCAPRSSLGMVGLSFASVPLYRLFCQVTGLAARRSAPSARRGRSLDAIDHRRFRRQYRPRASLDVSARCSASMRAQDRRAGTRLLSGRQPLDRAVTGTAVFNVTPPRPAPISTRSSASASPSSSCGRRERRHAGGVLRRSGDRRRSRLEAARRPSRCPTPSIPAAANGRGRAAPCRRIQVEAELTRRRAMADSHAKHHDYHLVDPSPWPAVGAVGAFILAVGAIIWMHGSWPICGHARRPASACSTRCSCGGAT